jgi:hypothetical protein
MTQNVRDLALVQSPIQSGVDDNGTGQDRLSNGSNATTPVEAG